MKIKLTEWASRHYSPTPKIVTLRAWANSGQIFPPPEKVGSHGFMVEESAVRIPASTNDVVGTISDRARSILMAA